MKKTLFALAAAATIAAGTLAAPSTAEARCYGWGCGVGLGVLGGVVVGSHRHRPARSPPPRLCRYDDYYADAAGATARGYWARRPIGATRTASVHCEPPAIFLPIKLRVAAWSAPSRRSLNRPGATL